VEWVAERCEPETDLGKKRRTRHLEKSGVGGLDAGGGEDLDMTMRMRKAGWSVRFAPDAICYTDVPETFKAFIRQRFRWERDAIRLRYRKHRDQVSPLSSKMQPLELVHQLEFLIFDVGAALAMPIYLV
jgi:cellulose synthase/poly-beta-1,6-N-acetylglucosamine synthase-like glycosyltransferase